MNTLPLGKFQECKDYVPELGPKTNRSLEVKYFTTQKYKLLKILQARLQQYVNDELPDVQAGFRKGRGTRDQIATYAGSSKKQESSRKTSISA